MARVEIHDDGLHLVVDAGGVMWEQVAARAQRWAVELDDLRRRSVRPPAEASAARPDVDPALARPGSTDQPPTVAPPWDGGGRVTPRTCARDGCDETFTPNSKAKHRKYCSDGCRAAANRDRGPQPTREPRTCDGCGHTFAPWRVDQRFCSDPCRRKPRTPTPAPVAPRVVARDSQPEVAEPSPDRFPAPVGEPEKTLGCEECDARFAYPDQLSHHRKVRHTPPDAEPDLEVPRSERPPAPQVGETREQWKARLAAVLEPLEDGLRPLPVRSAS